MTRNNSTTWKFLMMIILTSSLLQSAFSRGGHREYERKRRLYMTRDAAKNMFPSMVSIQTLNLDDLTFTHVCGGSILTKRWILTAAHCLLKLSKNPENLLIRYGSNVFEKSPNVNVEKMISHREFKTLDGIILNDIALLKTMRDFRGNWSSVQLSRKPIGLNKNVTVAGWGLDSKNNVRITLKYGFMVTKRCPEKDHLYFICGQGARVVTTADSGGPMFYMNALVGLISFHITSADAWYGYFTDVNKYLGWIAETMRVN